MSVRRVLAAVRSGEPEPLATAVELAVRMPAALVGLFVEDEGWRRLAALPFARVAGAGPVTRGLDPAAVERVLRCAADDVRAAVAAAAPRLVRGAAFDVARGALVPAALARAEAGDLLVVDAAAVPSLDALAAVAGGTAVLCVRGALHGPVVVHADETEPVVEMAARLAAAAGRELRVVVPPGGEAAVRRAQGAAARAGVVARRLAGDVASLPAGGAAVVVAAAAVSPAEAARVRSSVLVMRPG